MSGSAGISAAKNRRTRGGLSQAPPAPQPTRSSTPSQAQAQAQAQRMRTQQMQKQMQGQSQQMQGQSQQMQSQQMQMQGQGSAVRITPIQVLQKHEMRIRAMEQKTGTTDDSLAEDVALLTEKVMNLESELIKLQTIIRTIKTDNEHRPATAPTFSLPVSSSTHKKTKGNNINLEISGNTRPLSSLLEECITSDD